MARPAFDFSLDDPATLENLRRYLAPPAPLDTPEDVSSDPSALGATAAPQAAPAPVPAPQPPDGMDMAALAKRFLAARQQGQREAWANHAGSVFDAAGRNILAGAGVNASPVVQERPGLADKPIQDLEAQTRLEMMARKSGKAGVQPARTQKSTDATSPESRAAQKALLAQFRDLTPADVADVPEAYAERFAVNHNAALDRASREKSLTSQEQREQARLEQQAKEGTLNRSVQWARLRQDAEEAGASREFRRWLFEQEENAKEKERADKEKEKTEAVQVPGFDVQPGVRPTPQDAETIKKINAANGEMLRSISDLRRLHAQYGTKVTGAGALNMRQTLTALKLAAKTIADLGALSGPDMGLMNDLAGGDPTTIEASAKAFFGVDNTEAALQQLERWAQNRISAAAEARGYRPKPAGQPARAPATSTLPKDASGQPTLDAPPPKPSAPPPPKAGKVRVREKSSGRMKDLAPDVAAKVLKDPGYERVSP